MHAQLVCRHRSHCELHAAVRTGDTPYNSFSVRPNPDCASSAHHLFLNPRPNFYRLKRHGLGLGNVFHQYMPSEEANEHVEGNLYPLRIPQYHHAVVGVK